MPPNGFRATDVNRQRRLLRTRERDEAMSPAGQSDKPNVTFSPVIQFLAVCRVNRLTAVEEGHLGISKSSKGKVSQQFSHT